MAPRIRNAALERDNPLYEGILDQAGYRVCEYTGVLRNVVPFALDDPVTTDRGDGSPSIARAEAAVDAAPDGALAAGPAAPNPAVATLTTFINGSLIEVSMTSSGGADPEQVAFDVVAALVEAF